MGRLSAGCPRRSAWRSGRLARWRDDTVSDESQCFGNAMRITQQPLRDQEASSHTVVQDQLPRPSMVRIPFCASGHTGWGLKTSPGHRRKEEDKMRKFLLASVATLGTGGLIGTALAQAPAVVGTPRIGAPTQGQQAYPAAGVPNAFVNNNNNYQAPALPGALANPTPGTIVVHVNGKVEVDFQGSWTSADQR